MSKQIINKTIVINTSVANVWRVFTDPVIRKQTGGEYLTDWRVGSLLTGKHRMETFYTKWHNSSDRIRQVIKA